MKPVYLLTIFYNKIHEKELAKALPIVKWVSAGEFIRIEAESQTSTFAFTSSLPSEELVQAMSPLVGEHTRYLLVELNRVVATSISRTCIEWMAHRLPGGQK